MLPRPIPLPRIRRETDATSQGTGPKLPPEMEGEHQLDFELVQRAMRQEPRATAEVFRRLERLPGFVQARAKRLGISLHTEEAEEAVQDVLVTVWQKFCDYDGRASIEAWAGGIATFAVLKVFDRRQAATRFTEFVEGNEPQKKTTGPAVSVEDVNEALGRIGPPGDEIARLKHFEDLTFAQIAARLEMPSKTVMSRYYRTLDRLRFLLAEDAAEGPSQ